MERRSGFLGLVAALLFAAVCAYIFARLYSALGGPAGEAAPVAASAAELQGLVLREETLLRCSGALRLSAGDGERYKAGALLGEGGGELIAAPCSAIFYSSYDGLEYLSPECCDELSVASLDALMAARPSSPGSVCGRLVTGLAWYYAAYVDENVPLSLGGSCLVQFEGFDKAVKACIISLSDSAEGRRALLLRLTAGGDYLSLRRCSALLICP